MSLHEAAWQAYMTAQADDVAAARQSLATVLTPYDPTGLGDPVHADVTPARTMMVFDAGTFHIATIVRANGSGEVKLATLGDDGKWTAPTKVNSLAHLGELVGPPPAPGEEHPVWWQRHSPDGFEMGDKAWYPTANDTLYEVVAVGQDGKNQWQPDAYGWEPVAG